MLSRAGFNSDVFQENGGCRVVEKSVSANVVVVVHGAFHDLDDANQIPLIPQPGCVFGFE